MKFRWKLLLAFYLPLHFAFGCFYLSDLTEETRGRSEARFSFDGECGIFYCDFGLSDFFLVTGIILIILSVILPSLLLYRKYQTQPTKLFDY